MQKIPRERCTWGANLSEADLQWNKTKNELSIQADCGANSVRIFAECFTSRGFNCTDRSDDEGLTWLSGRQALERSVYSGGLGGFAIARSQLIELADKYRNVEGLFHECFDLVH